MFFDPLYWAVIVIGLLLSMGANIWVQRRVEAWSDVSLHTGMSRREVAECILRARSIEDVSIEITEGMLSDHYDPSSRTLRLSPDVYHSTSVMAAGIAAHEVGHALQDQEGYLPMRFRQSMVPVANIGTNLGLWLIPLGLVMGMTFLAQIGVWLFGGFVVFTLVTLPVEFDASARARQILDNDQIVDPRELEGVGEVLNAAAATYVAAAVTAILQMLYWLTYVYGHRDT